jgi:hypothetical protein
MRSSIESAVHQAIILECRLPHPTRGMNRSCLSSLKDRCYRNDDPVALSHVIYNGIVEYAINEFKIDYNDLNLELQRVLGRHIRYNRGAASSEKLKYGFYGEVLLDLILRCFFNTDVLIARGYFYSPLESSEPKGFDAFHVIEFKGRLSLLFGEAKFHIDYKQAIKQVLEKIHVSLSDQYINKNFLAIMDLRERFTTQNSQLESLLSAWESNPSIVLIDEMNSRNMQLIYPIFIAYEQSSTKGYYDNIKDCINYISQLNTQLNIAIPANFNHRIFFLFLPVREVKKIKERVIEWIDTKEPLMP